MCYPVKIDISTPCHQDWGKMTPSDAGRYCNACQETVIDFSLMSDQEIRQYLDKMVGPVCGRLSTEQLNKVLQPPTRTGTFTYWKQLWQLFLAGTLLSNQAKSQVKMTEPVSMHQQIKQVDLPSSPERSLQDNYHLVTDEHQQPLPGATVDIDGQRFVTDSNGIFRSNPMHKKITISYIGYTTRRFSMEEGGPPKYIALKQDVDVLDAVVVKAPTTSTTCSSLMGSISTVRVISRFDQFRRNVNQLIGNSAMKLFPNPVVKGQPVTVQLSLPQTGKYVLRIFTADGKLMYSQSIQVLSGKQQLQWPVPSNYSSGVYWLHIQSLSGKQTAYETKFVIR